MKVNNEAIQQLSLADLIALRNYTVQQFPIYQGTEHEQEAIDKRYIIAAEINRRTLDIFPEATLIHNPEKS